MRLRPLPLTLRQLQYVVAVGELLHFRKAAERCGVSQPTLSAQVMEIEGQLGVQLFERGTRSVRLTVAGSAIVEQARRVLIATEDLLSTATQHLDPLMGTLRLGVIPTIAPYMLADLDPALRSAFPTLSVEWSEDKTEVLVAQLKEGAIDGALMALEADLGGLAHHIVGDDKFLLAAAPNHPLASRTKGVAMEHLSSERLMLLADGHCFGDQVSDFCGIVGAMEHDLRATSLSTLVTMVAAREGLTLLPEMAVEVENRRAALELRRFEDPEPKRTIVIVFRTESALGGALEEIAKAASEVLKA